MEFLQLENIKVLLSVLGALQAFILAAVIWFYPRKHRTSNRLLSLFVFSIGYLLIINRIAEWTGHQIDWLLFSIQLLGIISLYLYIKSLFQKINWKKQWWHLLVLTFDAFRLYIGGQIRSARVEDGGYYYQFFGTNFEYFSLVSILLVYALYFFLSLDAYKEYRKRARQNFSDELRLSTQWVYLMIYGRFLLIILDFGFLLINYSFPDWYAPIHGIPNTLTYTIFAYFITIKGKLQPAVYQLRKLEIEKADLETNSTDNSELLLDRKLNELAYAFISLMEKEQMFKQESLSVKEVADKLDAPAYLVSQAINIVLQKPFFELVNSYRVEEAKKLMTNSAYNHLSMVGIAFEAGFNSKTAFNIAFKKYTGMTPTAFKNMPIEKEGIN